MSTGYKKDARGREVEDARRAERNKEDDRVRDHEIPHLDENKSHLVEKG